jgi:hypothetical protein
LLTDFFLKPKLVNASTLDAKTTNAEHLIRLSSSTTAMTPLPTEAVQLDLVSKSRPDLTTT